MPETARPPIIASTFRSVLPSENKVILLISKWGLIKKKIRVRIFENLGIGGRGRADKVWE